MPKIVFDSNVLPNSLSSLMEGYLCGLSEVCHTLFGAKGEAVMYEAIGDAFKKYLKKKPGVDFQKAGPWERYCEIVEFFTAQGFYTHVELDEVGGGLYWMLEAGQYAGNIWEEQKSWERGTPPCPLWSVIVRSLAEIGYRVALDEVHFRAETGGYESTFHFEKFHPGSEPILARARREIRESMFATNMLNVVAENTTDAIFLKDIAGRYLFANKAVSRFMNKPVEDILGNDDAALLSPDAAALTGEHDREVVQSGRVLTYEETITFDGVTRTFSATRGAYRDEEGNTAGVFGISRDITERNLAEAELRTAAERLMEAESIAHMGSWTLDVASGKLEWSDEVFRLFEIDPVHFGASYEAFLNAVHPDDRDAVSQAYTNSLKTRMPYDITHRLCMSDGRIKWVHEKCVTYFDATGKPLRSQGMVHDITERKQAEEEIRQLNNGLEQRVTERTAELESFSYSVSHDLRVPLRAVDGFSRLLLTQYADKLDDEGKRLLNVVRDNTQKMGQLIDDILAFSRAGRLEFRAAQVDMEALVHEVWQELQPSIAGRDVHLTIKPLPRVQGDTAMLRQVWVNLLGNAAKFTNTRAVAHIEIGAALENNECTFYVKDNGAGFDMQYADKLFGVFQRLHGVAEFEGTGIGLAIVKRIVTRHGGRVWAEGKVGEGATFYFALPAEIIHGLPA